MAKMMMIDTEEGLITWCKSVGNDIRLQKRGAKIILDYLSGHGRMLSTNPEGELFMNDEHITEKTTLDDVVDLVCEWNYEALSDARERKENPNDFLDYCRCCSLEQTLDEQKFILDRIFKQTVYGKDVQTIAHKLAMEMMKEMHLVPIYDIPIADEIGAFNKVSEKSGYSAEDSVKTGAVKEADVEADREKASADGIGLEQENGDVGDIEPDKDNGPETVGNASEAVEQEQATTVAEVIEQPAEAVQIVHTEPVKKSTGTEAEVKASDKTEENKKEQGRSR